MSRRVRLFVLLGAALAVVILAGTVAVALVSARVDDAIPQADLFGTDSPSATGSPVVSVSPTPEPGADITGPLNILIVGVDTRVTVPGWQPHSDAVMVLHVSADLRHAYLFSLPRDLVVDIPAFAKANFSGERTKLTHAMSYGSYQPGSKEYSTAQGFQLLAKTVGNYTGITRFDAGAILNFGGLRTLVDQLGGVDLYVDQKVVSIHMRPDGKSRTLDSSAEHGYRGPQAVYQVGNRHLVGWQALDYARQRYLDGSDYARQRHQRQLVKALIKKAFAQDAVTNPSQLDRVLTALGEALVFDGRGHRVIDFGYALRNLSPVDITLVGLPGGGVYRGGTYLGEQLNSVAKPFFAALRSDELAVFLANHPNLVNKR